MTQLQSRILVVDDEPNIRIFLKRVLSKDGHDVMTVASGEEALDLIQQTTYDLVLLDLRLKGVKGLDVLSALRQLAPATAVIVLTGHASLDTAVEALRQGAADYLFKPAKTIELRESVRTALVKRQNDLRREQLYAHLEKHLAYSLEEIRSTLATPAPPSRVAVEPDARDSPEAPSAVERRSSSEGRFFQYGAWFVDFMRHVITLDGSLLELTPTEFDLLAYMIGEAPRVVPHQELLLEVQGYESESWEASDTVRYHVYNIRNKINEATKRRRVIRTVRGVGYAIDDGCAGDAVPADELGEARGDG